MRKRLLALVVLTVSLLSLGIGCQTQPAPAPSGAAAPASAAAPAAPAAPAASGAKIKVTAAVSPGASSWYPTAVGLHDMISKSTNLDITSTSTAGPLQIVAAVAQGQADIGIQGPGYMMASAFQGVQDFKGQPQKNLRTLVNLGPMFNTALTTPSTGITSFSQLKGKKVAWYTAIGNSLLDSLLREYGLDPDKDVVKVPMAAANEGHKAIGTGTADIAMVQVGPAQVTLELLDQVGRLVYLPVEADRLKSAKTKYPTDMIGVFAAQFEPSMFPPLKVEKPFISPMFPLGVAATTALREEIAYSYTKAMLENEAQVTKINPNLQAFSAKTAATTTFDLPYHDGAIKVYKEKGLWTDELEKWQQGMVALAK